MIFYTLFFLLQFLGSCSSEIMLQKNPDDVAKNSIKEKIIHAYRTLNLTQGATNEQITKNYRELSLKWHPDKNSEKEAEEKFKEISNAYTFINKIMPLMKKLEEKSAMLSTIRQKQLNLQWLLLCLEDFTTQSFFDNSLNNVSLKYISFVKGSVEVQLANNLYNFFASFALEEQERKFKDEKLFNFFINFSSSANELKGQLNQTSLCFFLTPVQQIAILYFLKGNLNYCFVSEKEGQDASAYEFIDKEIIKFKLSNNYDVDYFWGEKQINAGIELQQKTEENFSDVFTVLNMQKISTSDFLEYLLSRLKGSSQEEAKELIKPQIQPKQKSMFSRIYEKIYAKFGFQGTMLLLGVTIGGLFTILKKRFGWTPWKLRFSK